MRYDSDIEVGKRYRDTQTGVEGICTALTFYQFACERAIIEVVEDGKIQDYMFDAPRMQSVETGEVAETARTGGGTTTGRSAHKR